MLQLRKEFVSLFDIKQFFDWEKSFTHFFNLTML
jgi:hypothetical protein